MSLQQYLASLYEVLNHPFNRKHQGMTLARILFWKINQSFFHFPALVELDPGVKCLCYPDSSYGSMVVYNRWAEYNVMSNIVSFLKTNSIYIDVGANIGDTTIIAAAHTQNKIYAFEPSPVAYPRLQENIALNKLGSQVVAEKLVLSNHRGYTSFIEAQTSETSHISPKKENVGLRVRTTTLDDYSQKNALKTIDLLKIDVEGAELLVLKGAARLLRAHQIRHLLIELNPNACQYGYTNTETILYLKQFGYRVSKVPVNVDERIVNIHAYSMR